MNWQFLLVVTILFAAALLVWRSSGKKAGGGCKCGCAHDPGAHARKDTAVR
jgi:hypothetical protein